MQERLPALAAERRRFGYRRLHVLLRQEGLVINKAFTARAFDTSTKELGENSQPGQQFYGIQDSNHGRVMIFAGGIPLKRDGQVVGVSGEQDQSVAGRGRRSALGEAASPTHQGVGRCASRDAASGWCRRPRPLRRGLSGRAASPPAGSH